jgi:hypothetical protein
MEDRKLGLVSKVVQLESRPGRHVRPVQPKQRTSGAQQPNASAPASELTGPVVMRWSMDADGRLRCTWGQPTHSIDETEAQNAA